MRVCLHVCGCVRKEAFLAISISELKSFHNLKNMPKLLLARIGDIKTFVCWPIKNRHHHHHQTPYG